MRSSICIFILFALCACARPKYFSGDAKTGSGQGKAAKDCTLAFAKSKLCLSWEWITLPTESTAAEMLVKVYRLNLVDQSPVPVNLSGQLDVILTMPSMGHAPVPVQVANGDVGTYQVSHMYLYMPGLWQMQFQVINGGQVEDQVVDTYSY